MNKTRLVWIDSLKGWLMLLVVMGHAIQYCMNAGECESNYWWNLIYSFHMPAFMALSGFVNYRPNKSTPPSPSENGRLGVYHRGQNRYHDST
ncbi:acyltransferase family protein [Segatella copri]|uniref:acyltransferase family protein n=1 Tax=Segatella copri TaxID=165179 RepID=UPI0034606916